MTRKMVDHLEKQEDSEGEGPQMSKKYFQARAGEMYPAKGQFGNVTLYSWDVVPFCSGDKCPASNICPYKQKGRCRFMNYYLGAVSEIIFENFGNKLSEPELYRIGMHLMPLYRMLARFKLTELSVDNVIAESSKGDIKAHPIFKEIRDTIRAIEYQWKRVGLVDMGRVPEPDAKDFFTKNDGEYYDE